MELGITPDDFNTLWKRINGWYDFEYNGEFYGHRRTGFDMDALDHRGGLDGEKLTGHFYSTEFMHSTINYEITLGDSIIAWWGAFGMMQVPAIEDYHPAHRPDGDKWNYYVALLRMITRSHMDMD
jgi:hypothetical protein